ncbi:hypothetical protein TNCT_688271 [Trichonephila clavata]|uniref:Uncharacterized protein n=2 Tax=Trichonephila TaxID=2585208 RepID=A0A8X6G5S4_TRICU|nr:hypothetical protein TNCT_688271 [Trichonephila clavata]GFS45790.1 hypothetical protein TNIN_196591 [Trichonephila inaurata madagascariensis]
MASPQGALIKPSYCPQRNGLPIRDCSNSSHDGVGRVSRVILTPEDTYVYPGRDFNQYLRRIGGEDPSITSPGSLALVKACCTPDKEVLGKVG